MGEKRDSVRTLADSGEKVVHHPDGEQDLIRKARTPRRLASSAGSAFTGVRELRERALRRVQEKRDSLDAGDSVPDDKRPV